MPAHSADDIEDISYLHLLVLGSAKSGKSCTVVKSAPKGVYVINSDLRDSLRPVTDFTTEFDWDYAPGTNLRDIEICIANAREGVKAGTYQTIVWDTITEYCRRVEEVFAAPTINKDGEPDGRRYHPKFQKHVHQVLDRLFAIPAHIVVNSHWDDEGGGLLDNQLAKKGEGIVPMLVGKLRKSIPRQFPDVVFLERKGDVRNFIVSDGGIFTPGCKNLPGVTVMPADVTALWDKMTARDE